MDVIARTLAAAAVVALLVPVATAQDRGWWREMAAREAQRARDAQRAELIRQQYERRRSMAHARLRSGEGSTLYASTLSAADVQLSCPVEPAPGMRNVIELVIDGRHGPLSSAGGIPGQPGLATPFDWPGIFTPVVPQVSPAWDFDTVHAGHTVSDDREATASAGTAAAHGLPFLPSASDARGRQGIAHVLNRSAEAGEVRIVAVDDSGRRYGPLTLSIGANETAHVTSADLENGNADKGLFGATGPGVGDWRLELSSALDVEALSYVRASDGLVTTMHDVAPSEGTRHRVPFFNAASDWDQESWLRLINPGSAPAEVAITGIDSQGASPGDGVAVTLPAGASLTYTAAELESGRAAGLQGSLGDGTGEWRLIVESEQPLLVMSLISSSTGHLMNLSTAPSNEARGVHRVPLFPPTSDPSGRQGLVRVINRTNTAGEVRVKAHDDTQWDHAPLVLPIGAGETVHFNSNDLEQGNPGKGLSGGTGAGQGDWRLELTSDVDIEVLSYVRAWDGLLTAMHDVVPSEGEGTRHRVAMFNPQGSPEQERVLRLINPGSGSAEVVISGVDAQGRSLGDGVTVTLPAGASVTYTTAQLQTGAGAGLRGSLGDSAGEWRLTLESEQPLQVMSLLSSPSGHLSNLSTAPVLVANTLPPVFRTDDPETPGAQTPEDVFRTEVSPIVQAKCIFCHRAGGFPADMPNSRLQFNPATVEGHVELNQAVFEALIAILGEDEDVDDPVTYILNKVQGVGHGGGVQTAAGTADYASLERFLGLLGEAVAPVGITPETLFEGVRMESTRQTLRRAAIVFAGRVPTDAEYAAIEGVGEDEEAGEEALRATIRGLMAGPGFHEFLIRASNDRLFTDRDGTIIDDGSTDEFVDLTNLGYHNAMTLSHEKYRRWKDEVQYGMRRAPLELIAHVAENDLPYTEVLTADYIMANPLAAQAYGASTEFDDESDVHEFRPSEIVSYYRDDESKVTENTQFGMHVLDPGNLATDYPHAGILNTTVFLLRYPTTATNRNRARSRWTYYHFLGLDIEKSASRTTDPLALADTNNPTFNNPACTVCHTVLDPVAGAFQNYADEGFYRLYGFDSLDDQYRNGDLRKIYVDAATYQSRQIVSEAVWLDPGSSLAISHPQNNGCGVAGNETCGRDLRIEDFQIRDLQGQIVDHIEWSEIDDHCRSDGASNDGSSGDDDHYQWWGWECNQIPVQIPEAGNYVLRMTVWADQSGEEITWFELGASLYQEEDTWYRDMRKPGFGGAMAPESENSVQWLAQQIVADERFAEATVKFWWPAIMGNEVAEPPEDETETDFAGLLLASNALAAAVTRLADGFRSGSKGGSSYNLKDLLVEMALSKWFRVDSITVNDPVRRTALANAGARRLLTPEELANKTLAVTGFRWGRKPEQNWRPPHKRQWSDLSDIENGYGLLYGGIDSDGITERARDFTSVMAGVAQSHALQSSHPIIMREFFLLPDEDRLLFAGVDKNVSPTFEFGRTFAITADSSANRMSLTLHGRLSVGGKTVSLTFLNDFSQSEPQADRNIRLDRIDVLNGTDALVATIELEDIEADQQHCNRPVGDHFALYCSGSVQVPFTVPADDDYTVEVVAWADHAGDELPMLDISFHSDTGNSEGANRIRGKLVELYDKLHGIEVTADSPEVSEAYELFVEVWERKRGKDGNNHFLRKGEENIRNDWWGDAHFLDGIVDDHSRVEIDEETNELGWAGWDWDRIDEFFDNIDWSDPQAVAKTWTVVLAYLMMDYRYLYL